MDNCSICLERIKKNDTIKRLSCNHYFHNKCFLLYCFQTEGHIFIECPLCREINVNNKKPHDDDLLNIKELCKIGRCSHLTKKKRRCKKKSYILNDGYCTIHNKNYLPKNKYSLMSDYLYWLLETSNARITKIYMIDIGKKLMIQYPEISTIQQIQYYFFRYYHCNRYGHNNISVSPLEIYNYYKIRKPFKEWSKKCLKDYIIY